CAAGVELLCAEVADGVEQRGLQPGEREVETGDPCDREAVGLGVSLPGEPVDRGAAGVAQPEKPRALVDGLAGSVVQRRPQNGKALALTHIEEQGVPAACEQAEK